MSYLKIDRTPMASSLLDRMKLALPHDDPYLGVIEDHRAALKAGIEIDTHTASMVQGDDRLLRGYSAVRPATGTGALQTLDIVIVPDDEEDLYLTALVTTAMNDSLPFTWWVREPRTEHFESTVSRWTAQEDRKILRLTRPTASIETTVMATRSYVDEDLEEVVRINNEAFVDHPDRANLLPADIAKDLELLGNRYDDLLLIDGGFCWIKPIDNDECEIYVLALDRAHQGKGLGRELLLSAISYIQREYESRTISLYVEASNERAISVYDGLGFADSHQSLLSANFLEWP